MKSLPLILLGILLIITFLSFPRDKNQFERFKSLDKTEDRQKFFLKWIVEPFLLYGLTAIICLIIFGQTSALVKMPAFLLEISESIKSIGQGFGESNFVSGMVKGFLWSVVPIFIIGTVLVTFYSTYMDFKKQQATSDHHKDSSDSRDLNHLLPLNFKERIYTFFLSLNAGFSEELFFRLLAPVLIFSVTGSALIAIFGSTLWFGMAHYYQGLAGIFATFMAGLVLFLIYLITQSIWIAILAHAVIDICPLVIAPWYKEWLKRRSSGNR